MAEFVGSHDEQVHAVVKMREGFPEVVMHQGDRANRSACRKQLVEPSSGIWRHPIPQITNGTSSEHLSTPAHASARWRINFLE
ncbi:hypothetical protein [Nocardia sp. NPDC051832]|uniref:hypothetical protein n=1 Tax=Nocardia sp. NPDC051832 TaxID=3155673 RepID=UPI003447AD02